VKRAQCVALVCTLLASVSPAGAAEHPDLQLVAEAFAAIDQHFVRPPDMTRLTVGALQGLEQALPSGVLHVADNPAGPTVTWQADSGKVDSATFPAATSIREALTTVDAVYRTARRIAPGFSSDVLISAMLGQAVRRLDARSSFIDRAAVTSLNNHGSFTIDEDLAVPNRGAERPDTAQVQTIEGGIAYVRMSEVFSRRTVQEISAALAGAQRGGMRAVALDLRNGAQSTIPAAVELAELFLKERQMICYTQGRRRDQNRRFAAHPQLGYPGIPMAVLVDKKTAGGGEIVAAALQDWKRATVVGTATYGSSSTLRWIPLSDGSGLRLTTAEWFSPKGRSLRGSGVVPDVSVDATPEAQTAGPDQQGAAVASDAPLRQALLILKTLLDSSPK
jgi:carboxyl-terminal processing protease